MMQNIMIIRQTIQKKPSLLVRFFLLLACITFVICSYMFFSQKNAGAVAIRTTYTSGNTVILSTPVANKSLSIAADSDFSCVLTTSSLVYCSGDNSLGSLGSGNTISTTTPIQYGPLLGKTFSQIGGGYDHNCALSIDQIIYCAGSNTNGQFGDGSTTSSNSPVQFGASLGKNFKQVAAHYAYSCGLTIDQLIYCSGTNTGGMFGNGVSTPTTTPVQFGSALGKTFSQVSGGVYTICGLTTDQQIYCSGSNSSGQFGNGNTTSSTTPIQFGSALGKSFKQVAAMQNFTCGLTTDLLIYCAGSNASGQFGNGTTTNSSTPVQFGASLGKTFRQVSIGQTYTCALTTDQLIYCAGNNDAGQLGNGTLATTSTPLQFGATLGKAFTQVSNDKTYSSSPSTQRRQTCALTTDQLVYCAGYNNGNFGNGTTGTSVNPVAAMQLP